MAHSRRLLVIAFLLGAASGIALYRRACLDQSQRSLLQQHRVLQTDDRHTGR